MMVEAGADIPLVQQQSKRECGGGVVARRRGADGVLLWAACRWCHELVCV